MNIRNKDWYDKELRSIDTLRSNFTRQVAIMYIMLTCIL